MEFTIRPAKPEDAASIAHVSVESWRTTYKGIVPDLFLASLNEEARTESWQQQLANNANYIFIAQTEIQNEIQTGTSIFGFISGGIAREVEGLDQSTTCDSELYAVYLLESHQRQGAGRALIRTLATALHAQGHKSMMVQVLEANPAVHFYQRLGAIPITSQNIQIGSQTLPELVLAWPTLHSLL
jgi:ribosomal protein S18 acetylase RimI-like enzyme